MKTLSGIGNRGSWELYRCAMNYLSKVIRTLGSESFSAPRHDLAVYLYTILKPECRRTICQEKTFFHHP